MWEVHIPILPRPTFFTRVRLLTESLRAFGGEPGQGRVVVTVAPEGPAYDLARAMPWSAAADVDWRWADRGLVARHGLHAVALERFLLPAQAEHVLLLDADTLCVGPLDELAERASRVVAGVVAHAAPPVPTGGKLPHDASHGAQPFWDALFATAGLSAPRLCCEHTTWGVRDHRPDWRFCPPYFNLGAFAGPTALLRELGEVIFDELGHVDRFLQTFFRGQLALSLALARTGVPWAELPLRFNLSNRAALWRARPPEAADVRILHYHETTEVDRDRDMDDDAAIRRLAGRQLTRPNAVLASAMVGLVDARERRDEPAERFPFCRPVVAEPAAWVPFLSSSYRTRVFANGGPAVRQLEERITDDWAPGGREAVLVSSATSGIAATLIGLGVRGPVVAPSFTFAATAAAIEQAGCEVVLCDVDPSTWELDPVAAELALAGRRCGALVAVRPFGLCRDLAPLEAVAERAGVPLVVDSAAAFGGTLADGALVGGAGVAEVFSCHATKVFAIGEGGIVMAPPDLARHLRQTINFGQADGIPVTRGLNAKMSELTAAVGSAMLKRLPDHVAVRARAAARLQAVAAHSGAAPAAAPGRPPWQAVPVLLSNPNLRDAALEGLRKSGVDARAYYRPPLHLTAPWGAPVERALPTSEWLASRMLCLPVYSDLHRGELDELAGLVHLALKKP